MNEQLLRFQDNNLNTLFRILKYLLKALVLKEEEHLKHKGV